ncbi:MAG: hypothetical protein LGB00_06505 [Sulfurovum sp.]|nr:hypothetical protein [Sulfurovum sp.]
MFFKKNKPQEPQSDIKNIATINAYTDQNYIYAEGTFRPLKKLTFNKTNLIISYLSNKDFITSLARVSKSVPDEDLDDVLEIKVFEELGLSLEGDYVVTSYETKDTEKERAFHFFVSETEKLESLYFPIKKETKYIDLITPAPLLFRALYQKEILDCESCTHCFVYLTRNDAFVTLYANGEYIYSKSIDFSLEQIYDKFCEIEGEQVDKNHFFSILKREGLATEDTIYRQNFIKIFEEMFVIINDIIIYTKRAFELDSIDCVYIGSAKGPIVGLSEHGHNCLRLPSEDLNFDYQVNSDEQYVDQLQSLMLLTAMIHLEGEHKVLKIPMYARLPAFTNRASGQFIIATSAAVLIGLSWPLYNLMATYINDVKTDVLINQNKILQKQVSKYKNILNQKRAELEKLDKKLNYLSTFYNKKTKTLKAIYHKKVDYRLKSDSFYVLANELHKFGLYVDKIRTKENIVKLFLSGSNDRKLTELIKYISEIHVNDIKGISIKLIERDPRSGYYRGILKMEFK